MSSSDCKACHDPETGNFFHFACLISDYVTDLADFTSSPQSDKLKHGKRQISNARQLFDSLNRSLRLPTQPAIRRTYSLSYLDSPELD